MELLRDIVSCLLLMTVAGGWTFLCLLILSFMLVYYIPFHLKWMIPVSVAAGVIAGILYVVNAIRRRKK